MAIANLHAAVLCAKTDLVEEFIRGGADVNRKDGSGRTPMDCCAITKGIKYPFLEQTRLHIAGLLLSHGASPNIQDKSGWSIIHSCAWHDDLPLLKMCVRKGGKIDIPDYQNRLPVYMAFVRGNTEVVEYLETQSCDIKAQCRSVIRKAMGKRVHRQMKELPVPPSMRLFVNHNCPYDGWEAPLVPEAPWKVPELGNVGTSELKQFIVENASEEFIEENKEHMTKMADLIDTFQTLYLWESFKTVKFEEPIARPPRYSMDPSQVKKPDRTYDFDLYQEDF